MRYSVSGYFNFFNPTLFICVCICLCMGMCATVCVEVKGQLSGVGSSMWVLGTKLRSVLVASPFTHRGSHRPSGYFRSVFPGG